MDRCKFYRYNMYLGFALFICGALLYSCSAKAEVYYWERYTAPDGKRYDSAVSACESHYPRSDHYESYTYAGVTFVSATRVTCQARLSSNGVVIGDMTVIRKGDSCLPGTTYDSQTGECLAPQEPNGEKCGEEVIGGATIPKIKNAEGECVPFYDADKPSQCKHFSESTRFTTAIIAVDDNGNPSPPPPIVEQGCVATVIDYSHCKAPAPKKVGAISLGPAPVRCRVALNFTGAVADGEPPVFAPLLLILATCVRKARNAFHQTPPSSTKKNLACTCLTAKVGWSARHPTTPPNPATTPTAEASTTDRSTATGRTPARPEP